MKGIPSCPVDLDPKVSNLILFKSKIFLTIFNVFVAEAAIAEDPCNPNPCGPYSNPPRSLGVECKCSCLPEMTGTPPNCRPECTVNQDCSSDKACQLQKCADPCIGLCGINAFCRVQNHIPICVCNKNFYGDPFLQCQRLTSKKEFLFLFLN